MLTTAPALELLRERDAYVAISEGRAVAQERGVHSRAGDHALQPGVAYPPQFCLNVKTDNSSAKSLEEPSKKGSKRSCAELSPRGSKRHALKSSTL